MTIETELPAVKVNDMAEASSNGPVAWRYRLEGWGEQYWHYFTKEPRYKEAGEIWQPLYLQPGGITAAEIERLRRENEHFTKSGIIEVAIRNISVSDYMNHWEGRALAAEAKLAALTLKDDPGNEGDGVAGKPVICIGHHTINQLMAGQDVEIEAAIMVPASDLCQSTPADRRIAELEAEVSSYQGLLDAAIDDYNNARNTALEEAAKAAETAQISGSLVRPGVAAAIRALIPEREG